MQIQVTDPRLTIEDFKPSTSGSAGIDLHACMDRHIVLEPNQQVKLDAGFKIAINSGWVGIILPRSGLGSKGLVLGNTAGVIDSDYRGPVGLVLLNRGKDNIMIDPYMRVAQLLIVPCYAHMAMEVGTEDLPVTKRGTDGWGSTGN